MNSDPLEWLLPEAPPRERAELRRLVQALGLLRTDQARPGARSVEPSWSRARGELDALSRRETLRALDTLLGAYLAALLPADAFLPLPAAPLALDEAWRVLLARGQLVPPHPGEPLVRGARALLARGLELGAPDPWCTFWRAAFEHAEHGRAPGRWQRELSRGRAARTRPRVLARFVGGLAASELERGAPARALQVLTAQAPLARLDPGLVRLTSWCEALLGRPAPSTPTAVTPLPRALFELASEDPRYAAAFPGQPGAGSLRPLKLHQPCVELGASVLTVLECGRSGAARVLHLEGATGALAAALAQAVAPRAPLERAWRHGADAPWASALGGARTRALVRLALPASGTTRWLQLEWSHALVPCRARLLELARSFVLDEQRPTCVPVVREPSDPRAPVLAQALRQLRARGVERLAAFEPLAPARPLFVLGPMTRVEHLARAGEPAARALGLATYELRLGARSLARVHAAAPVECLAAALEPLAPELLCASFRALELVRGRSDPWFLPEHLLHGWSPEQRGPWWLRGPPGSGRRTRARALLFAAGFDPDEPGRILAQEERRVPEAGEVRIAAASAAAPVGVVTIELAPLAARRAELAALLAHLARTRRPPLALNDEALAELWRRDWEGFAVLGEVLDALAPGGPGLDADAVRRALAELGLAPLAQRAPVGADLALALAETRHRNGATNRARAARWLGVGVARLPAEEPRK